MWKSSSWLIVSHHAMSADSQGLEFCLLIPYCNSGLIWKMSASHTLCVNKLAWIVLTHGDEGCSVLVWVGVTVTTPLFMLQGVEFHPPNPTKMILSSSLATCWTRKDTFWPKLSFMVECLHYIHSTFCPSEIGTMWNEHVKVQTLTITSVATCNTVFEKQQQPHSQREVVSIVVMTTWLWWIFVHENPLLPGTGM